ncbi:hypothetical protein RYA05_00375 [Pseudomonas syringae pv. actinidiae]|nr:hypothetical protein [Pseudomonas syringae pv. actinidiae]
MQETFDIQTASQRLFALSRKNHFSLAVNNLAQAQYLINAILGIESGSGELVQSLEAEAECLVETARASGYRIHQEFDGNNKLAYLEIIAKGAQQQSRRIKGVSFDEIEAMLVSQRPSHAEAVNRPLGRYKPSDLIVGHIAGPSMLKRREPILASPGRIIFSIGDTGSGHIQRAQNVMSQAISSGWPVLVFDFLPEKLDLITLLKRSVESARRNKDFCVTSSGLSDGNVTPGSTNWMEQMCSLKAWHHRVFGGDPDLIGMAKLLHALTIYVGSAHPKIRNQVRWLNIFSSLEHVLGLIQGRTTSVPSAILDDIEAALEESLGIGSIREITSEQSAMYGQMWEQWVAPFEKLAELHQNASEKSNADFVQATTGQKVLYTAISDDDNLGARNVLEQAKSQLEKVEAVKTKALVLLRVSGSGMQNSAVIEMTKKFGAKGYQLVIVIDGQAQKSALIAQKLAMAGRADCLWHTCNVLESAAFKLDLGSIAGTQCLLVNRERLKEPLMLLPSN